MEYCRALLRAGADCGAVSVGGATPLHRAAFMGHREVVELLLAHGTPVEVCDSDGLMAADKAAVRGHDALARRLKSAPTCKGGPA